MCRALAGDAVGYVPLDKRAYFVPDVLEGMEHLSLVCIDNVQCIAGDEEWELALFNLYNRVLETWSHLSINHRIDLPVKLILQLPDLASRLDWGKFIAKGTTAKR